MTRAQAAAIIARLLKLKENADAASVYKDLADAKWAAGFIGAVTPKYMQGITNGKFNPSGKITVEQLATVMVRVLDLKIDEKATVVGASSWAQPYVAAALAANLMKSGSDYKTPAIRELLVETIYGAAVVISTPVVAPEPPKPVATLEIEGVSSYSQKLVAIQAKTALTTAPAATEFAVKDDASKAVAVSAVALKDAGKTVLLTVAEMISSKVYTLTFGGKDYKFVAIPTETSKPTLTTAVATNNKTVKATFSENVEDSALDIKNYTVSGLQILSAVYDVDADNKPLKTTVILTTAAQTAGTIYKLVVTNVMDYAGNLIDADNDEKQFGGLAPDTTKPKLLSAAAVTNTTVQLTFDEEVDEKTATTITNYTITAPALQVLSAAYKVDGNNKADKKVVVLTTATQTAGSIYNVLVTNVTDMFANVIDADNDEKKFGGLAPDTTKPELTSAVSRTNTTVLLTFNEEVKKETAEDAKNYAISGLTVSAAKFETDKKSVTITTSSQSQGIIYTAVVTNVQDVSGNVINADKDEFKFGGMGVDTTKPTVSSANATSATQVKVVFSEPVEEASAKSVLNYYFGTELGYPTAVTKDTVVTTGTTWLLTTVAQKRIIYTLDVTGVKDLTGNVLDEATDEATFGGMGSADTTAPKVTSAIALNKQEFRITFDEALDKNTVVVADFVFSVVSGTDTATTKITTTPGAGDAAVVVAEDKKSVTYAFKNAEATPGVIYKVTVNGVNDANGNAISTTLNNASDFVGINQADSKPTVTSVIALDAQTLKVSFSEKVKGAENLVFADFVFSPAYAGALDGAVLAKDGLSATYYFKTASFTSGTVYTIQMVAAGVAKITDEFGLDTLDVKSGQTYAEAVFAGNGSTPADIKIAAITAVNANTIDITFNKEITKNSTINVGLIEDVNNGDGTTFNQSTVKLVRAEGDDKNKIRVFFDTNNTLFTAGALYQVKLVEAQVKDNNGYTLLAANDNGLFVGSSTANDRPKMTSAMAVAGNNTVEVTFSEALKVTGTAVDGLVAGDFTVTASNGAIISSIALKADSDNKVVILTLDKAQTSNDVVTVTFVDATPGTSATVVYDEAGVASVDASVTVKYVAD
jgi:hypothetical protein